METVLMKPYVSCADCTSMQANCGEDWILGFCEIFCTRLRVHDGPGVIHARGCFLMVPLRV